MVRSVWLHCLQPTRLRLARPQSSAGWLLGAAWCGCRLAAVSPRVTPPTSCAQAALWAPRKTDASQPWCKTAPIRCWNGPTVRTRRPRSGSTTLLRAPLPMALADRRALSCTPTCPPKPRTGSKWNPTRALSSWLLRRRAVPLLPSRPLARFRTAVLAAASTACTLRWSAPL